MEVSQDMPKEQCGNGITAKIAIICLPERGGYYPTFPIARSLEKKGHIVAYPGPSGFRDEIEKHNMRFVELFPETFDENQVDPNVGMIPQSLIGRLLYRRRTLKENRHRFRLLRAIVNGELEAFFNANGFDLVLLDPFLTRISPVIDRAGVRCVSMATELVGCSDYRMPHNHSLGIATGSIFSNSLSRFYWAWRFLFYYLSGYFFYGVRRLLLFPKPSKEISKGYKAIRRNSKRKQIFSEYGWRSRFEEIVLCPSAFDFPIAKSTNLRRYFGSAIDPYRGTEEFLIPEHISQSKYVIYASLGTHSAEYKWLNKFIDTLIDLAKQRRDYYFIINIGKGGKVKQLEPSLDNVRLAPFFPQLAVLQKSDLVITNGGLGTLKEAIMEVVPMLVCPCRWDQFGNAARVKFHGIGETCSIKRISVKRLSVMLDKMLAQTSYKESLRLMKSRIHSDNEFEAGINWLNELAVEAASKQSGKT